MNIKKLVAAMAMAAASFHAAATTITFDELTPVLNGEIISTNYAGLVWDNFGAVSAADRPGSGYESGLISGSNVGVNWDGQAASFSSATAFTLDSFYVAKAWYDGVTHVSGYNGSTLLYSTDIYSTTTAATLATFNWSNVTRIVISDGTGNSQSVIDNISISAVPEPETYAMLLAGLGLVGAIVRRRHIRVPRPAFA
jgi:hypothetical protein